MLITSPVAFICVVSVLLADFYTLRERDLDELLPWDFIDAGVTKEFLQREWKHATQEEVTPNCRMKCSGCGAGRYKGGVCIEGKN